MINFVGNKKIFIAISLVLMIASIASLLIQGFNLDTDFAGGMAVTYQIDAECEVKDIEAIVSEALGANKRASSVQKSGTGEVIIKFGYDNSLKDDAERAEYAAKNIDAITAALTEEYTDVTVINRDVVSPSTGKELARSAVWMSIFAALAILIYITIRFEFISGVCAVLCLIHDVLILCGIYSITRLAVDTTFIAAVLTVLGYSINATIVVFDRVRENTRHAKKQSYGEIANASINQTLTRSINATVTTLLTIGMVYIMGVSSIKAFALPIIIGILIGTYSSVCIASNVWAIWKDAGVKNKK